MTNRKPKVECLICHVKVRKIGKHCWQKHSGQWIKP